MGLDFCESNQSLRDYVVTFNTYDEAYEKLCEILKIK